MPHLITFLLIIPFLINHAFGAENSYDAFRNNMLNFKKMAVQYCDEKPSSNMKKPTASLYNNNLFRTLCGKHLNGKRVSRSKYMFYYTERKTRNITADILGFSDAFEIGSTQYFITNGWYTNTQNMRTKDENNFGFAVSTLYEKIGGNWEPVWDFVDENTRNWKQVNPFFSNQKSISVEQKQLYDKIWKKYVIIDTNELIKYLKENGM